MGNKNSNQKEEIDNTEYEEALRKREVLRKKFELYPMTDELREISQKVHHKYKAFIEVETGEKYWNKKFEPFKEQVRYIENTIAYNVTIPFVNNSIHIKRFELTDDIGERIETYRQIVSLVENYILPKFNIRLETLTTDNLIEII